MDCVLLNSYAELQPQKEEMPKNGQTTAQLHSSHMLVR